jgi:predicted dehydrogenase
VRVQGDAGTLELDNPVSPHSGATLTIESANSPMPQIISGGETTFHHQLRHVIQVIEGRVQPLTGGDDAIGNMRGIDAIYRAAGLKPRGLAS